MNTNPMINLKDERTKALEISNSPLNVHDHLKGLSVEELKEISDRDRLPWHTLCLNITGDLNVGTIIRTSHCMGCSSVTIFGRQKIDNRSLVGAANYTNVVKVPAMASQDTVSPEEFESYMNSNNLVPIFIECGGLPLPLMDWEFWLKEIQDAGKQICLVMGNESGGIPANILSLTTKFTYSMIVSIPQKGVIRSMNVAVAHAMVVGDLCSTMGWMN